MRHKTWSQQLLEYRVHDHRFGIYRDNLTIFTINYVCDGHVMFECDTNKSELPTTQKKF